MLNIYINVVMYASSYYKQQENTKQMKVETKGKHFLMKNNNHQNWGLILDRVFDYQLLNAF